MAETRANAVTLRGNPVTLVGPEIKAGQSAPDFSAVDNVARPGEARPTPRARCSS